MTTTDKVYPINDSLRIRSSGLCQTAIYMTIKVLLLHAEHGDHKAESRLCNYIGKLRRNNDSSKVFDKDVKAVFKEACRFLVASGRKIDLKNPNPRCWISKRNGDPRY